MDIPPNKPRSAPPLETGPAQSARPAAPASSPPRAELPRAPAAASDSTFERKVSVNSAIRMVDPDTFDPRQWESALRPWLSVALEGPLGGFQSSYLDIPPAVCAADPDHANEVGTRHVFADPAVRKYLTEAFRVRRLEGPWHEGVQAAAADLERLSAPSPITGISVKKTTRDDRVAVLRYFFRLSQFGYGPLTLAQANAILERSPRIVEVGAGKNFNSTLLRAVGGESVQVRSFDNFAYMPKRVMSPDQWLRMLQPWLAASLQAQSAELVYRQVLMSAEALIQGLAEPEDLGLMRHWLTSLAPYFGEGPENGSAASLRSEELRDYDLFLSYPPRKRRGFGSLVGDCVKSPPARARHIHLIPGDCHNPGEYPNLLLVDMLRAGWKLDQAVPSFLPSIGGINDLLTFVRV